jgi:cytidylate kinase
MVNIVEQYININKQLIILISGFSGSGKTLLAKNIQRDFKLDFLNLNDFFKSDYNEIVDLGHNIKVIDWDNPDAIDWDKFNEKVNSIKNKGVVISGFGFPNDRIKFKLDFHIYLKISKDKLLKNRHDYLDENKDNPLNEIKDTKVELLILNNLSYKHFMNMKDNSTYTFRIDTSEQTPDQTYDQIFDYIIENIEKIVYKK